MYFLYSCSRFNLPCLLHLSFARKSNLPIIRNATSNDQWLLSTRRPPALEYKWMRPIALCSSSFPLFVANVANLKAFQVVIRTEQGLTGETFIITVIDEHLLWQRTHSVQKLPPRVLKETEFPFAISQLYPSDYVDILGCVLWYLWLGSDHHHNPGPACLQKVP